MAKVNSRVVGAAGEHYVLYQLLKRGWIATQAPDGVPNMDIIVTDEESKQLCSLQVKTRRPIGADGGWHMKEKHESISEDKLFYVFVDFGEKDSELPECYILPSRRVADVVKESHRIWMAMAGLTGKPHNDSIMRRFLPDYSKTLKASDSDPDGQSFIENHSEGWLNKHSDWDVLQLQHGESRGEVYGP